LIAMVVNDNAGSLASRGVLGIIASKLAPTRAVAKFPPDQRQLLTSPASVTIENNSR